MRLHLDALVLLQRVWGSFGLIAAAALAILGGGAELALLQAGPIGPAGRGAVAVLGTCALILGVGAAAAFVAARGLRLRRAAGRAGALALAIPNLLIVPFGTALGVYTLWVLLNDDARREFGRPPRGPAGQRAVE